MRLAIAYSERSLVGLSAWEARRAPHTPGLAGPGVGILFVLHGTMLIDPAFQMVLRNDAVRIFPRSVWWEVTITREMYHLYGLAGLTDGEERLWALFATAEEEKEKQAILGTLIARQPSLRLALLLDSLAELLLTANIADLRTRSGSLSILRWVDHGCPSWFLPISVPGGVEAQLIALRKSRIGWVVPPKSGGRDHGLPSAQSQPVEYPRVWLSEAELRKYRADLDWPAIFT